jgi:hypothetical protein
MDWRNVDLEDGYERDQNIIDAYSFDTLLLEISCNIRDINPVTVRAQFETSLKSKIDSAREVFENNFKNIVNQSLKEKQL